MVDNEIAYIDIVKHWMVKGILNKHENELSENVEEDKKSLLDFLQWSGKIDKVL